MQPRIMFIDCKSGGLAGSVRIGRVEFSQTGRTLYYRGKTFKPVQGYKYNYVDEATGEEYWISGCKKRGGDTLYGGIIQLDDDVRERILDHHSESPGVQRSASGEVSGREIGARIPN